MSAHIKQRKQFEALPGQFASVVVETHMIDPTEAEEIIRRIFKEADDVVLETKMLYRSRETAREEKASGKRSDVAAKLEPTLVVESPATPVGPPPNDPVALERQLESLLEDPRVPKRGRPRKQATPSTD